MSSMQDQNTGLMDPIYSLRRAAGTAAGYVGKAFSYGNPLADPEQPATPPQKVGVPNSAGAPQRVGIPPKATAQSAAQQESSVPTAVAAPFIQDADPKIGLRSARTPAEVQADMDKYPPYDRDGTHGSYERMKAAQQNAAPAAAAATTQGDGVNTPGTPAAQKPNAPVTQPTNQAASGEDRVLNGMIRMHGQIGEQARMSYGDPYRQAALQNQYMAHGQAIQDYRTGQAQAYQASPGFAADSLGRINANPELKALYQGTHNVDATNQKALGDLANGLGSDVTDVTGGKAEPGGLKAGLKALIGIPGATTSGHPVNKAIGMYINKFKQTPGLYENETTRLPVDGDNYFGQGGGVYGTLAKAFGPSVNAITAGNRVPDEETNDLLSQLQGRGQATSQSPNLFKRFQ